MRYRFFVGFITIIIIMCISVQVYVSNNEEVVEGQESGNWFDSYISALAKNNIYSDYSEISFDPNAHISVAEFIAMVVRAKGYTLSNSVGFLENSYITKGLDLGLLRNGEFNDFNRKINRGEIARIISRTKVNRLKKITYDDVAYEITDFDKTECEIKPFVLLIYDSGIMGGYKDGTFRASNLATYAEASAIVYRTFLQQNEVIIFDSSELQVRNDHYFVEARHLAELINAEVEILEYGIKLVKEDKVLTIVLADMFWTDVLDNNKNDTKISSYYYEDKFFINLQDTLFYLGKKYQVKDFDKIEENGSKIHKIPILIYHHLMPYSLMDEVNKRNGSVISVELFEKQMQYLADNNYTTITLRELYLNLRNLLEIPERSVVITFDDGYQSVIKYAYPILKKHQFVATQFLITNTIGRNNCFPTHIPKLTWGEMKKTKDVFSFNSHTHFFHWKDKNSIAYLLSKSTEKSRQDLQTSLEILEAKGFNRTRAIAFPFGQYSIGTIELLEELNFQLGFTVKRGYFEKEESLLEIDRFSIAPNISINEFQKILTGYDRQN